MKRASLFLPLFLLAGCGTSEGEGLLGSTAPNVKVETLKMPATPSTLNNRRGNVVLMDFWATWCGPCRAVTPILEKIYAKYKDQGLEGMAITAEAREIVAINEGKRPHEMPVYLDTDEEATKTFGANSLPTIVVIDRKGQIVYRTAGASPEVEKEVSEIIELALRAK